MEITKDTIKCTREIVNVIAQQEAAIHQALSALFQLEDKSIQELYQVGKECFGTDSVFFKRLVSRIPALGNKKPIEYIAGGEIDIIVNEIGRIEWGNIS